MDPDNITDKKTLTSWLQGRSDQSANVLAMRSAARAGPIFLAIRMDKLQPGMEQNVLAYWRQMLCGWVAANVPTPAAKHAAYLAAHLGGFAGHSTRRATYSAAGVEFLTSVAVSPGDSRPAVDAIIEAASEVEHYGRGDQIWEQVRDDARELAQNSDPLALPLWSIPQPDWFKISDANCINLLLSEEQVWSFWLRWWDGVLSGNQVNWDLQRDVALIPDEDWNQGPPHIAKLIARLEEQFDLRTTIADLAAKLRAMEAQVLAQEASEIHRGHNHPPELIDRQLAIQHEVASAILALEEAETELAKTAPDPLTLKRLGLAVLRVAKAVLVYCAGLADIALKKSAEAIGDTGTKWAIKTVVGLYAVQAEPIQQVGKAILDFAQKWYGG